jgi:anti-sigma-K factor RskA
MKEQKQEKMFDLLTTKATYGLSNEELRELKELEEIFPEWKDDESFELAAVAINLANIDVEEKMPAHLQSKILTSAEKFFKAEKPEEEVQEVRSFERQTENSSPSTVDGLSLTPRIPFWQKLGWGVAAFACIALAVNLYLTRLNPQTELANKTETIQTPTPQLTDAQKREQLLASTKDTIKAEVAEAAPGKMPEIKGDIVWNNTEQKGYMRFRGLPVNDPTKQQYQLWIFDENQDEKYPIDGGVFDVNKDGEVIIPIDAKINVKNPKLFAVTKEKPGGVVVSDRTGIIAVAKV